MVAAEPVLVSPMRMLSSHEPTGRESGFGPSCSLIEPFADLPTQGRTHVHARRQSFQKNAQRFGYL